MIYTLQRCRWAYSTRCLAKLPVERLKLPDDLEVFPDQQIVLFSGFRWNLAVIRHNRSGEGRGAFAGIRAAVSSNLLGDAAQDKLGVGNVSAEVADHHFDGDGFFRFVPA